MFNTYRSSSSQ